MSPIYDCCFQNTDAIVPPPLHLEWCSCHLPLHCVTTNMMLLPCQLIVAIFVVWLVLLFCCFCPHTVSVPASSCYCCSSLLNIAIIAINIDVIAYGKTNCHCCFILAYWLLPWFLFPSVVAIAPVLDAAMYCCCFVTTNLDITIDYGTTSCCSCFCPHQWIIATQLLVPASFC